jgi:hypothetical protein
LHSALPALNENRSKSHLRNYSSGYSLSPGIPKKKDDSFLKQQAVYESQVQYDFLKEKAQQFRGTANKEQSEIILKQRMEVKRKLAIQTEKKIAKGQERMKKDLKYKIDKIKDLDIARKNKQLLKAKENEEAINNAQEHYKKEWNEV